MTFIYSLAIAAMAAIANAATPQTCPTNLPLSCANTTAVSNTCCFIAPGQLMQTQFWDTDPSTGPSNSWTIHGLWPDNCDGSYPQNCDDSRNYDIGDLLQGTDTLTYMKTYWKDYQGKDETFWEHEWTKHGTCIPTLDPSCYTGYQKGDEAVDFFKRVVALFKTLPTYEWLRAASITPSTNRQYALSDIKKALSDKHGTEVVIGCEKGALNQVWYPFNVQGSLQTGSFKAGKANGSKDTCPEQVSYLPKSNTTASFVSRVARHHIIQ